MLDLRGEGMGIRTTFGNPEEGFLGFPGFFRPVWKFSRDLLGKLGWAGLGWVGLGYDVEKTLKMCRTRILTEGVFYPHRVPHKGIRSTSR